jgi:hypothetical protein
MADYFLPLDASLFESSIRPALAACWRQRSFEPAHGLWLDLLPLARSYAERYRTGAVEFLVTEAARGLPFDRNCWRTLVGEVLLLQAAEIPEIQTAPETLCLLLAPDHCRDGIGDRKSLHAIQQAHRGSCDLTFGAAIYRPEHAGFHSVADVARLADYLAAVRPDDWTTAHLVNLPGAPEEEDRAEELALARQWFPHLVDFYQRSRHAGHVVVIESIY